MALVRLPVIQSATGSIQSDGHRKRIVPADVRGRFALARKFVFALLIGLWIALPWVRIGGAPAVFLDIDARKFFLFGATFNAQDTFIVFFLLSGVGFSLLYLTALAGRMWCGWACPQTVFLEGVFRRVERWIEGPRDKVLRRAQAGVSVDRVVRIIAKHGAFIVLSLLLAHVILAYFVSIPRAFAMVRENPGAHPEAFAWVVALSAATYGNFAWFREQVCVVVCPYGRLQSVLLDNDSLVVGYDEKRGEPRGKKGKATGDCVDCNRCVVVCPTGIDIRKGLQLDCIACTACIDACDEVMDKLERPRGLIRYDSLNGLAGRARKVVRPRVVLYSVLLVIGAAVAFFVVRKRTDFEATAVRLRGAPYTLEGDTLRNAFDLHVVNKRGEHQAYFVTLEVPPGMAGVVAVPRVELEPLGDAHVPLFLTVPRVSFHGDLAVRVRVSREAAAGEDVITVPVTFLGSAL